MYCMSALSCTLSCTGSSGHHDTFLVCVNILANKAHSDHSDIEICVNNWTSRETKVH